MRYCCATVITTILLLTAPDVPAQSFDGIYLGTMECQSRGGLRPLRTELKLVIAGNSATYERQIMRPGRDCPVEGCPSGVFERGTGEVTTAGDVALRGKAESKISGGSYSFDAEYRGKVTGGDARLRGVQRWIVNGQTEPERSCEIELSARR